MRYWCGVQPKLFLKTRFIRYELHLTIPARSAILMPVCRWAAICPWMQRTCHGAMLAHFGMILACSMIVASRGRSRVAASATAWTPSSSNEICVIAVIIIAHEFVLCRIRVVSPTRSIIVGAIGPLIAPIVIVDRHVLGDERLRFVTRCGRAVGAEQVFKPVEQEFATGNTGSRCSGLPEEAGRSTPPPG